MPELTHFSLFSGIGGLDLAAEMAGFQTVGQCEWADYPRKVLEKHWPDVPKWRDICELTADDFFRRTGYSPGEITCISGGFPCQPHSCAGKQLGEKDDRHLWPEFMRIVREFQPRTVVGENVPGILSTIYDSVCTDLEKENYKVWTFCVPAYAVGAHHERFRVFIVAVDKSIARLQAYSEANTPGTQQKAWQHTCGRHWDYLPGTYWAIHKPPLFGMVNGIPDGVDGRVKYKERMTVLGNAVCPQQAYPVFRAIAEMEGLK